VAAGDVAVTPHELSTRAALEIYRQGGNAVDAAIAANAVQGVVAPETCGVGGDLFALVHRPGDSSPVALNASGRAGSGIDAEGLRRAGFESIPFDHPDSVTIPGCVDGWHAMAGRFGTMPLSAVLAPAIRYASDGFPTSRELARALVRRRDVLASHAPELYTTDPPQAGVHLSRPALARTLEEIARGGRDAFYLGRAGAGISAVLEGRITPEDLAVSQAEWVTPVSAEMFGRTGWTTPPNSQGYLTLASTWIYSQLDPAAPDVVHLQIEAYRSVAWERHDLVTDPGTSPLHPDRLTAPDRLRGRVEAIDLRRAGSWPTQGTAPGGTAYLAFLDHTDMAVSLIQSNYVGIGSGIAVPDAGFFLQDRGAGFTLERGHPNELTPGRRPFHTLSPALWTREGRIDTVLGTRGGHYQPQLLLQISTGLFHAGLDPASVQDRPRWVIDDTTLTVESRMGESIVADLARRGHVATRGSAYEPGWGPVSIIHVASDGRRIAVADPRVETAKAALT
jgi:gamma-glutamyltranspeptidase/glutathione hydrolase